MLTCRFNKESYEVRETGKVRGKNGKIFTDMLNGYETKREPSKRQQLGLYKDNKLVFTLGADGKSIYSGGSKFGEVLIKQLESGK